MGNAAAKRILALRIKRTDTLWKGHDIVYIYIIHSRKVQQRFICKSYARFLDYLLPTLNDDKIVYARREFHLSIVNIYIIRINFAWKIILTAFYVIDGDWVGLLGDKDNSTCSSLLYTTFSFTNTLKRCFKRWPSHSSKTFLINSIMTSSYLWNSFPPEIKGNTILLSLKNIIFAYFLPLRKEKLVELNWYHPRGFVPINARY